MTGRKRYDMVKILDENGRVLVRGFSRAVYYMSGEDEWLQGFWASQIASLKAYANKLGVEQQYEDRNSGCLIIVTPKRCNRKVEWSFTFED